MRMMPFFTDARLRSLRRGPLAVAVSAWLTLLVSAQEPTALGAKPGKASGARNGQPSLGSRRLRDRLDIQCCSSAEQFVSRLRAIARAGLVSIGVEYVTDGPGGQLRTRADGVRAPLDRNPVTVGAALDSLLSQVPDFDWTEESAVINVRPASLRGDPDNVLNHQVVGFSLNRASLVDLLTAYSRRFTERPHVHTALPAGTVAALPDTLPPCDSLRSRPTPTIESAAADAWIARGISIQTGDRTIREILNVALASRRDATWELEYARRAAFEMSSVRVTSFGGLELGCVVDPLARALR